MPNVTGMSNRHLLKDATRLKHSEAELLWTGEGDRFCDLNHYRAFLGALYHAHVQYGLPAAVTLNEDHGLQVEIRRVDALTSDLGWRMQQPITGTQVGAMTEDFAWGVQYALNGSAMGASILLKNNRISDYWPKEYLTVMRDYATSGGLAKFFDQLERRTLSHPEAIEGAGAIFDVMTMAHTTREIAING